MQGFSKTCQRQEIRKWGRSIMAIFPRLEDLWGDQQKYVWIAKVKSDYFCLESQVQNVEFSLESTRSLYRLKNEEIS